MIDSNKINWIECDLPWWYDPRDLALPDFNEVDCKLETRWIAEANMTVGEGERNIPSWLTDKYLNFCTLHSSTRRRFGSSVDSKLQWWEFLGGFPEFEPIVQHQKLVDRYSKWCSEQPEMIEWSETCIRLRREARLATFCGRSLDQVGTLVHFENDAYWLIGGNPNYVSDYGDHGTNEDYWWVYCPFDLKETTRVKRYAVLLQHISR